MKHAYPVDAQGARMMLHGKRLVYSKSGGPYAGGETLQFSLDDIAAWGKLLRYGDALTWTVARLRDGSEVLVVATEQTDEGRREINRTMRRLRRGGAGLADVLLTRDNPWSLKWASTG